MNLIEAVSAGTLVALDTMVWIYEFEAHPQFGPVVHSFFRDGLEAARNPAGSSQLTLGELLVQPLSAGRSDLADRYRRIFTTGSGFTVWEVTREVVENCEPSGGWMRTPQWCFSVGGFCLAAQWCFSVGGFCHATHE